MNEKIIGIYAIKNSKNHKVYIGASTDIHKRWKEHTNLLRKKLHANPYLQEEWSKFGESCFCFLIIEECKKEDLDEKEKEWILKYGGIESKKNYNVLVGGKGGYGNNEWSKKISETVKKHYDNGDYDMKKGRTTINKNGRYKVIEKEKVDYFLSIGWSLGGRKKTQSEIEKYRQSMIGEKNPAKRPEVRKKISEALKGKPKLKSRGVKKSKEFCEKIKNLVWITNGVKNTRVSKNCVNDFINKGWKKGRSNTKNISLGLKKYWNEK